MIVRQWLWRVSAGAPLPVWVLSLALPLAYAGWSLQDESGSSLEELRQQREEATSSVVALQQELETVEEFSEENLSDDVLQGRLEQLLRFRCGLEQGIDLRSEGGRPTLMVTADSLASLCALRMVRRFPGGVRYLLRQDNGMVNLTWEGA